MKGWRARVRGMLGGIDWWRGCVENSAISPGIWGGILNQYQYPVHSCIFSWLWARVSICVVGMIHSVPQQSIWQSKLMIQTLEMTQNWNQFRAVRSRDPINLNLGTTSRFNLLLQVIPSNQLLKRLLSIFERGKDAFWHFHLKKKPPSKMHCSGCYTKIQFITQRFRIVRSNNQIVLV